MNEWNPELLAEPQTMDEDAQDLMPLFASQMQTVVQSYRSAAEAGDTEAAAKLFHRIKGSAATFGFRRLADAAAEAEGLVASGKVPPSALVAPLSATISRIAAATV